MAKLESSRGYASPRRATGGTHAPRARGGGRRLVICIANDGYPMDLEPRKVYVALPDEDAERHGMIRVIDESGEDYLFPKKLFKSADDLPQSTKKAVLAAPAP